MMSPAGSSVLCCTPRLGQRWRLLEFFGPISIWPQPTPGGPLLGSPSIVAALASLVSFVFGPLLNQEKRCPPKKSVERRLSESSLECERNPLFVRALCETREIECEGISFSESRLRCVFLSLSYLLRCCRIAAGVEPTAEACCVVLRFREENPTRAGLSREE